MDSIFLNFYFKIQRQGDGQYKGVLQQRWIIFTNQKRYYFATLQLGKIQAIYW
ncbi:unnamed protein product [Paramecium sonneborni]|uniref:Uncharacterized protein n=1 Tax=Paramecium sonneborni TaxID=65129 RepID=A0A8S1L0V4_9CILI|nr:unnamed protein product [Paramecium sonneborni]